MMALSLRKLLTCIMVVLAVKFPYTSAKETVSALEKIKEQFDSLDRGKLAVGAAVGFVGSRLALRSAITAVKVASVALVVYVEFVRLLNNIGLDTSNWILLRICSFHSTVVLQYTGVLEELPMFSQEQIDMIQDLKGGILKHAEGVRVQVSRRLNHLCLKKFVADEKSVTFGAAGGAILGFLF
jgi:hypothetical protein